MKPVLLFYLFIFAFDFAGLAQDPLRFQAEIDHYVKDDMTNDYQGGIVFTGSSSIRFWLSLREDFPNMPVINRGFGGSQMSDLLYFAEVLILKHKPSKVFIYEGDNDLFAGKPVETILNDAKVLYDKIRSGSPNTEVFFISAKPSPARWSLRDSYLQLNYRLGMWTLLDVNLHFIDIWTPMCNEEGQVMEDLFLVDRLHMNEKGYAIWKEVIGPFVNQ